MRLGTTVCLVVLVASLCDGIVVFPDAVAEQGLFPFPLYIGGLPVHVAVMFLGFYGALWIGSWAGKAKIEKEFYYDEYEEEYAFEPHFRSGRGLEQTESEMRHTMTKTLRRIDVDKCLEKLVCYLEEQNDRLQEEDVLLKLFPVTRCKFSVFPRCTATGEQLRELLRYYQSVEMKRTLGVLEKGKL
ncbi:hypothetical protein O3P69_016069 [Scylla paramamosain]|uniref:Uncharacterized protein n=1 Tax=Scylla paramamosain TaxID=85552 RepID=A0AAW0T8Y8_SCYPA